MSDVKNIVQFIIDATRDQNLQLNFKNTLTSANSINELKKFFDQGQYIVSDEECLRILENKDKMLKTGSIEPNY
jgi:hypothetical protein